MSNSEFLQWIHDRLATMHGEHPDVDYMIRLRKCIEEMATGEKQVKEISKRLQIIERLVRQSNGPSIE